MPLMRGKSSEIRDENIKEMIDAGHPEDQAVAAAYRVSGEPMSQKKQGPKGIPVPQLKRPTLHPAHPFNNAKAPDNRAKAPVVVPGGKLPVVSGGKFAPKV